MNRALAAGVLALLLAPEAQAQTMGPHAYRATPTSAEVTAQATYDTSYLLASYMAQLAAAGAPPSQADIDAATRQYFTNGAAATSMPATGPGAAYFHDGASVVAYGPSSPTASAAPTAVSAPGGEAGRAEAQATVQPAPATVQSSANELAPAQLASTPTTGAEAPPEPSSCTPGQIEAAMAFATRFTAATTPAPATTPPAAPATAAPATQSGSTPAPALVLAAPPSSMTFIAAPPACVSGPSLVSRVAPAALVGALLGGLAVAFLSRIRWGRGGANPRHA